MGFVLEIFGILDQVISAAETFAISSERDYMNSRIQIGAFYASSQFEGQIRRNTITSIGPVQRDPGNTSGHFVSHRAEIFHGQTIHARQERDDGMPAVDDGVSWIEM